MESTKSRSEIYALLTGTVVEVNAALVDEPELVNEEPYGKGWILVLELADPAEVATLLDAVVVPGPRPVQLNSRLSTLTVNSSVASRVRLRRVPSEPPVQVQGITARITG